MLRMIQRQEDLLILRHDGPHQKRQEQPAEQETVPVPGFQYHAPVY